MRSSSNALKKNQIIIEEGISCDGKTSLYRALHVLEQQPSNSILLVIHGFGEHSGRYLHLVDALGSTFSAFAFYDQKGHGKSGGLRGHCNSFEELVDDLISFIFWTEKTLKKQGMVSLKIHALGHSMGGLVLLLALLKNKKLPLTSVLLSSPCLGLKLEVPWVKAALSQILNWTWSSLQFPAEIRSQDLTQDPHQIELHQKDQLVHDKMTPRFYSSFKKAMKQLAQPIGLKIPLLCLVSLADRVVSAEKTLLFFQNLRNSKKKLKTYPDFYHELFNELGREQVFEEIKTWVRSEFEP